MLKKILVPLDGSKLAEKAIPYAEEMAHKFQAEVILLRVLTAVDIPIEYGNYAPRRLDEAWTQLRHDAETYLQSAEGELQSHQVAIRSVVVNGHPPAENILNLAAEKAVDLIIMSTHGRSGLGRWVHGSVADKVLQHAPCPVLLVRAKEE